MCGESSGIIAVFFLLCSPRHGIFCLYLGRNSIRRKSSFCWIRNRYGAVLSGPALPVAYVAERHGRQGRTKVSGSAPAAGGRFPNPE